MVLLAFDLMSPAVRCPPARVSESPFFRTGGVSYCVCATARLRFYARASVSQPGGLAACLGAQCVVLRVEWLLLFPGLWSGLWAEEEGNVWQLHPCVPPLSLLQINPCNVV